MKKTNKLILIIAGMITLVAMSSIVTALVLTNGAFYQRFTDDPMITLMKECGGTYQGESLILGDDAIECIRHMTTPYSCLTYAETEVMINGQAVTLSRQECKEGR